MAEKKRAAGRGSSAERKATAARQSAESDVGALDNPDVADEPSEIRHVIYFVGIVGFGLTLNMVALLLVSGGS